VVENTPVNPKRVFKTLMKVTVNFQNWPKVGKKCVLPLDGEFKPGIYVVKRNKWSPNLEKNGCNLSPLARIKIHYEGLNQP